MNDPKWIFASLPERHKLAVHCKSCDRVQPVDRWEMSRKHGKQTIVTSLLPKLRCDCGVKGDCEWKDRQASELKIALTADRMHELA
ncbi:hypothetical protein [Rhizobium laguerreae]|uniref:hypothetical protein n=1 Tax=Rhizobium laguerreae TaxID=1076926 RepID=UPI001C91D6BD|nr:hypothetical protein [Rhizobium laguerreae]MBY3314689.1 hypothetical protein [Rhizobium laguerreae]